MIHTTGMLCNWAAGIWVFMSPLATGERRVAGAESSAQELIDDQ